MKRSSILSSFLVPLIGAGVLLALAAEEAKEMTAA